MNRPTPAPPVKKATEAHDDDSIAAMLLELQDGSGGNVFLPVLYPGSYESPDEEIRLGRKTDWNAPENGPTLGVGMHLFLVGEDAVSLPEWRQLMIEGSGDADKPSEPAQPA